MLFLNARGFSVTNINSLRQSATVTPPGTAGAKRGLLTKYLGGQAASGIFAAKRRAQCSPGIK